jgi:hypothetical protein
MKTFWEFSQQLREDAMPPAPGGAPPMPGGGPPGLGGPMGGGMPPMGGGVPMGGPPGLGGPPMGGGAAPGATEPAKQIRPSSVWEILEKIVDGKPVDKLKKSGGQSNSNMIQGVAQPSPQPSDQLAPPSPEQGMAPAGPPAQAAPPPMM